MHAASAPAKAVGVAGGGQLRRRGRRSRRSRGIGGVGSSSKR